MKILVYGAGGVGGYFGARLAESGNKVSFIARGEHMRAIKESGLQLESINGNITVYPELVTNDINEVGTPDLVLLGVKSWQLPEVASELKKIISKDTIVLPLQNGADIYEKLTEITPTKAFVFVVHTSVEDDNTDTNNEPVLVLGLFYPL